MYLKNVQCISATIHYQKKKKILKYFIILPFVLRVCETKEKNMRFLSKIF